MSDPITTREGFKGVIHTEQGDDLVDVIFDNQDDIAALGDLSPGGLDKAIQFNNNGLFGGIAGVTTSGTDLKFADSISLLLGDSNDLVIFHNGTVSRITNNTGNLEIINGTGGDLVMQSTGATNKVVNKLGTNTTATAFVVESVAADELFKVLGDGAITYTGTLNGVLLTSAGSAALFLNEAGSYSAPPAPGAGGADEELQFNSGGILAGIPNIKWNGIALRFDQNSTASFGNENFDVFHNGTAAALQNDLGDLFLQNLSTAGNIIIQNLAILKDIIIRLGTTTNAVAHRVQDSNSNDLLTVLANGKIGIHTPAPDSKLTIVEDEAQVIGTWDIQVTPSGIAWDGITFGLGLFVACGATAGIMTSVDGKAPWTNRTNPGNAWTSIAFGGGVFVAVALNGAPRASISTDGGITFVTTPITSRSYTGIAHGNGVFVAVASVESECDTSPDGLVWTARTMPASKTWRDVATDGNGTFVAVSNSGGAESSAISTDNGVTWSSAGQNLPSITARSITFGDGLYVVVSDTGTNRVHTSPDGINWTARTSATQSSWRGVSFGNHIFMAVASDISMSSKDGGITWVTETAPVNPWDAITFANDTFVSVASSGGTNRAMILSLTGTSTAILDLQSTSSGFLPPRMTELCRDNITSPVDGLLLHNISTHRLNYHDDVDWRVVSTTAETLEEIFTPADLDRLAVAGVITVVDGENLTIVIKAPQIATSVSFALEGSSQLTIRASVTGALLSWSGTGAFVSGDTTRFVTNRINILSISTGSFIALASGVVNMADSSIIGFDDLGTLSNGALLLRFSNFIDCDSGFTITNSSVNILSPFLGLAGLVGNFIDIVAGSTDINVFFQGGVLQLGASNALIGVDPGISDASRFSIQSAPVSGGQIFDTTGGTQGTFTAVANAGGSAAITSVTDSGGVARFNHVVGPTLHVNQEVVNSTFVTNTDYNGTFLITAAGAGFYEVASIAFGSDEAGSLLSNSITLTDTATTLVDGDTIVIDTDFSTDYDGGAKVYNQLTNSFQINRAFTATQTGDWDTSGINQKDPRVLAFQNPGFIDSKYIAAAHVNDNAEVTTIPTSNTFVDIVFGTVGNAIVSGSTMERFKLVDEINCILEYTGNEPFDESLPWHFTGVSSGGAVNFRYKWQLDTGSGFGDFPDNRESLVEVGSTASSTGGSQPMFLTKGNRIKPQTTRNTGTSTIIISYATIG